MGSYVVVGLTTTPDLRTAEQIVHTLVTESLIACGNISQGLTSIYRWQGEVERSDEVLIIMKTTEALASRVTERVRELHPYDVPEVLFLPVTTGNDAYAQWVRESVLSAQDEA